MRVFIVVIFSLLILSCHSDVPAQADQTGTKMVNVQELEKKGFAAFQEAPGEAIPIFKEVASAYLGQENLPKAAITYLNIANIFDEHLEKTDSALLYSQRSLAIWQKQDDTMQMANLYKYIGLLQGRLGAFDPKLVQLFKKPFPCMKEWDSIRELLCQKSIWQKYISRLKIILKVRPCFSNPMNFGNKTEIEQDLQQ
jgi:hypothetical protein